MSRDVTQLNNALRVLRAGIERHARGEATTVRWTDGEIAALAYIEELYRDLLERAIKVATWYGHDLDAAVGEHLDNAGAYPPPTPVWDEAEFERNASAIKAAGASIYPKEGGSRGD